MDALMISKISNEIVNETILLNWKFYVLLVLITFVTTCISSYVFPYLKTRGKALATEADFKSLLKQLQKTTETTETIKRAITHNDWALKELKLLRRQKLEELLIAIFEVEDWVDSYKDNKIFGGSVNNSSSPICKIRLIGALYFNEIASEISSFTLVYRKLVICVMVGHGKLQAIKNEKSEIELTLQSNPEALLEKMKELNAQQVQTLQLILDEFVEKYKELIDATYVVEGKASLLMKEITGVEFEKDSLTATQ